MPRQARYARQPNTEGKSREIRAAVNPDQSDIAHLAYLHWLDRGRPIGSPEDDWCRTEQDLKNRQNQTA
jgi:hypothetical protein